jgi:hypothetical protein
MRPRLAPVILLAVTASLVAGTGAVAAVPAVLRSTESAAEDLVDHALGRDRAELVATAGSLKAAASGAAPALRRARVPATLVIDLRRRAARAAKLAPRAPFLDVALAANAVSELMPDLYARFRDPVPPGILRLDYLDREAQLRSLARQPEKVAAAVAKLERTWAPLRRRIIAAGGAREVAAYQRHVAAMKRLDPRAAKRVQTEAENGLALVDELEQVFLR